jgi:hypothetical protein
LVSLSGAGWCDVPRFLFTSIAREVEGENAFVIFGALQNLGMVQGPNRVVVAGLPMLLHRSSGKFVVLRHTLVIFGVVDEIDDVEDFFVGLAGEKVCLWQLPQLFGKPLEQVVGRPAPELRSLELIDGRPRAARKPDVLLALVGLDQTTR